MFSIDSIAALLEREDIHISSHVEILKADLPSGKALTLKIEAPTRDMFGQPRKARLLERKAKAKARLNRETSVD